LQAPVTRQALFCIFKAVRASFCFLPAGLLLLISCSKDPALYKLENLNGDSVTVIGHGGMGTAFRYPTNSYESLSTALNLGVHGVEMDVQMSADSVLYLFHNTLLEDATSCKGNFGTTGSADLDNCEYSGVVGKTRLTRAADFFESEAGRSAKIFVFDLKQADTTASYSESFSSVVLRFVEQYSLTTKCFIESPHIPVLRFFARRRPELNLFVYTDLCSAGIGIAEELGLFGITMDMDKITNVDVKEAHARGFRISLFNARTERRNAEALLLNPDYIQTDRPEYLLEILRN
jgi:glycerophosphoryl diester phosphodiesterase